MNGHRESLSSLATRRVALWERWHHAVFADATILDAVPQGVTLVLLPEHDPELAESEMAKGMAAVRSGKNVYFRHLIEADLPSSSIESSPPPQQLRRTVFNADGSVEAQQALGPDGAWHALTEVAASAGG
ncbi:MAG TPA: DUF5647 family protein [Thermomicrobiales bacterium]|nr:DUF5647 family protein [Thermomicrobiales bacterium]